MLDHELANRAARIIKRREGGKPDYMLRTGEVRTFGKPTKAYGTEFYAWTNHFHMWYHEVEYDDFFSRFVINESGAIRRWERKRMLKHFEETGEKKGLLGNELGGKIARYFPKFMYACLITFFIILLVGVRI